MTKIKFRESIRRLIEYVKETVDPKSSEDDKHTAGKRAERIVKELFDWYDSKEE